ncbi:hypothetical protein ACHWQZ_G006051 [Mnemiopsis leidyi]
MQTITANPSVAPPSYDEINDYNHDPTVTIKQPTTYVEPEVRVQVSANFTRGGMAKRVGDRLIIDFEKVPCCPWETVGLNPDLKNYVPEELRVKGISPNVWEGWCEDLMKVQKKSPSVSGCMCLFCVPGFLVQAMLCAIFCPISADHPLKSLPCFYGDWHVGLDKWQRKVNAVLNPKDMHAKLKTYRPFQRAPKSVGYNDRVAGKDENYEMSMLIIALTATESQKLMEESWDEGVNDGCTSGIGRIL